ncbi:DUF397 domain-containing protein [Kitasatospora sp. NBC_01287]|uniref:DUF397 domain-containing protein n=1 Tax=Kitasatospora sp. NBC_01287 TaxID=2903573 RepID=UPI0022533603|nr:DUF397 domain-containing protein [Kitasatospora sp. NBC_01287]MCX4749174.1 DUF397 domain-containing protein [Kitasatospora sp. NBC_01287]
MEIFNGMAADTIKAKGQWQKAKRSVGTGSCVELRSLDDGAVAVRNSRHPGGPALVFTRAEIDALLDGARNGEFDHLAV